MPLNLQALCERNPFHRALRLTVERCEDGVKLRAVLDSGFAVGSPPLAVHGGVVATLLDIAATFALIEATDHDWVTVDLRVDYLRPTALGAVVLRGQVIHAGRSLGRGQGELRDGTGRLCALAVGTFAPGGTSSPQPHISAQ